MTTGSWNRDQFTYLSGTSGPWVGRKWNRTWTGTDYGQPPPFNPSSEHVIERVGLGAAHAREIFTGLAEAARRENIAFFQLQKDQKKEAYLKRKADSQARLDAYLKSAMDRAFIRYVAKQKRISEKAARKLIRGKHRPPFPKEFLVKGNIPIQKVRIHVPAAVNPKPPKRALIEDHPYSMNEVYLSDIEINTRAGCPLTNIRGAMMNGYATPKWSRTNATFSANDQIKLVNKLAEEIQGDDFNLAVFLAEGNQTLELIGDVAIRTAKALHHTVRGDFWGAARSLFEGTNRKPLAPYHPSWGRVSKDMNELAARVLELQYGIKPLFQDVYAGARKLAHQLNYPYVQNYKASVKTEGRSNKTASWSICPPGALTSVTSYSAWKCRRTIIARIKEADLPTLPQALGLMDPEIVIWEKIPFSFVWDWFQPIGPYLEARAAASRLRGVFVTSTKQTGRAYPLVLSPTFQYMKTASSMPAVDSPGFIGYSDVQFDRTVTTNLDVPMPEFKGLKSASSFQHCLNGLALLTSFATGFSKVR